jgi:hypothetical protein
MGLYRAAGGDNNEIYARGWRGDTMGTREDCGGGKNIIFLIYSFHILM